MYARSQAQLPFSAPHNMHAGLQPQGCQIDPELQTLVDNMCSVIGLSSGRKRNLLFRLGLVVNMYRPFVYIDM